MPLYCDYLIVSWMTGMQDWPGNNWWGGNRNNPPGPFMYYGWDCEWALGLTSKGSNEGAWVHPAFESHDQRRAHASPPSGIRCG